MSSNTDRQTFTEILPLFVQSLAVHMFNAGHEATRLCLNNQHDIETQLRKRQAEICDEAVAIFSTLAEKIDAANGDNTFDVTPFILPTREETVPDMAEVMAQIFGGNATEVAPGIVMVDSEPSTTEMSPVTGDQPEVV